MIKYFNMKSKINYILISFLLILLSVTTNSASQEAPTLAFVDCSEWNRYEGDLLNYYYSNDYITRDRLTHEANIRKMAYMSGAIAAYNTVYHGIYKDDRLLFNQRIGTYFIEVEALCEEEKYKDFNITVILVIANKNIKEK